MTAPMIMDAAIQERFDRLLRAIGVDGFEKLQNSIVSIIFDNEVGKYVALPFATAGIPTQLISAAKTSSYGSVIDKVIDVHIHDSMLAHGYSEALRKICNQDNIVGIEAELSAHGTRQLLTGSNVIIDCTTNTASKAVALETAIDSNIPFISASITPGYARMELFRPKISDEQATVSLLMPKMQGLEREVFETQNIKNAKLTREILGAFISGLIADEAVKIILGKTDALLDIPIYCKFGYGIDMFSPLKDGERLKIINPEILADKSALLFGGGAVGSNVLYWLARMHMMEANVLDAPDETVESSNLIRCPLYHDTNDWVKAAAAAMKADAISGGRTKSYPIFTKLCEGWTAPKKHDVYIDGFDNFYSRMLASNQAIKDFTPLLSASGRFDGFNIEAYIPNQTLCMDCNYGLNDLGKKEEAKRRQSCTREYTPQNTWINQSVGALLSLLLYNLFSPKEYGEMFNGIVSYDSMQSGRLYVNQKEGRCYHRRGGVLEHNVR
jgi:tRNA A37 threonylcarbamoyladenosine dehydratase